MQNLFNLYFTIAVTSSRKPSASSDPETEPGTAVLIISPISLTNEKNTVKYRILEILWRHVKITFHPIQSDFQCYPDTVQFVPSNSNLG